MMQNARNQTIAIATLILIPCRDQLLATGRMCTRLGLSHAATVTRSNIHLLDSKGDKQMTHTEIIRMLLAMPNDSRKVIGNCDVKRDGTGDYWCATTPRGYTAYYHASAAAAIIMSWL